MEPPSDEVARPRPLVSAIVPNVIGVGAPETTLFILGEGLIPESVVRLDGTDLPTTFVNDRQLRALLPASALAGFATLRITVFNAGPVGGESPPTVVLVGTLASGARPRITGFDPPAASAGDGGFELAVRGVGFTPASRVVWNGSERATTYVHAGEIHIEVAAADLERAGAGEVSVRRENVESFAVGFPILPTEQWTQVSTVSPLVVADVAADPVRDLVYATVPASAADSSNRVLALDPVDGSILWSVEAGSDPRALVVGEDGAYLHVGLAGEPRIARIALPSGSLDLRFAIGGTVETSEGDLRVQDLAAIPGHPTSVLATLLAINSSAGGRAAVYEDGERRGHPRIDTNVVAPSVWTSRAYSLRTQWGPLILARLLLGPDGPVVDGSTLEFGSEFGREIVYDAGLIFSSGGFVVEPETPVVVDTLPVSGVIRPDVANGRVHVYSGTTLSTFLYPALDPLGSVEVPEAEGASVMVRFGADGLLLGGGAQLVLVRSSLIGS